MTSDSKPIVGITMGDPAGIGPEVIVKAYPQLWKDSRPIVVGDTETVNNAIGTCDVDLSVETVGSGGTARFDERTVPVVENDILAGCGRILSFISSRGVASRSTEATSNWPIVPLRAAFLGISIRNRRDSLFSPYLNTAVQGDTSFYPLETTHMQAKL